MFPIPPHETLVENRVCKHCGVAFPITDKDMEFYKKVSPVFPGGNRHPELDSGSSSVSGQKKEEDTETSSA